MPIYTAPGVDRRPLLSYLRIQDDRERRLLALMRSASTKMDSELRRLTAKSAFSDGIRLEQLAQSQAALHRHSAEMWRRIGNELEAGRAEAAAAAVESVHPGALMKSLFGAEDADYMLRSAKESAVRNLATAEARLELSAIPLSDRVYNTQALTDGKIDSIINDALLRGASAAELAKDVRSFIDPNTPGGVRYAATRLGRTELNNAFHATQVQTAVKEPWTEHLRWNLSGSHPKPDQCNEYAETSTFAGGAAGLWKPEEVPGKPHPNCLCFTTPEPVGREEFIKQFEAGKYDDYLDEEFPGLAVDRMKLSIPAKSPVSSTPVHKLGSPQVNAQMRAAEQQRLALEKARYIQKGKGKGNLNPERGYTRDTAQSRQAYTEMGNSQMNALLRDPESFLANNDDSWVSLYAEHNDNVVELLKHNALDDDVTVARLMTGDFSDLQDGGFMSDPGFLSTTTDPKAFLNDPSRAFRESVAAGNQTWTFVIRAPKGTPALPGADYQKEIFFGPGTKQRILSVDRETNTVYTEIVR